MNNEKIFQVFFDLILSICIVGLLSLFIFKVTPISAANVYVKFFVIGLTAFFVEYINSSAGMGYGTILSPVLIILGYSPKVVVPAILFTELIIGIPAGIIHHKMGNVSFTRKSRATNIVILLTICSFVGAFGAVLLISILPPKLTQVFVSVIITIIGIAFFFKKSNKINFSWMKLTILGVLAAFNKAASGGGYGPLTTGGQVLAGIPGKSAIPITILSKAFVGAVGVTSYYLINKSTFDWTLLTPMIVGSIIPLIPAVMTVKLLSQKKMHNRLGVFITFLGVMALVKTFL